MSKISCSAVHCLYNNCDLCSAKNIIIEGKEAKHSKGTFCETFNDGDFDDTVEGLLNTNYMGEVQQMFNGFSEIVMTPDISCTAKNCVYNEKRMCTAGNVFINGRDALAQVGTECETFIPKE